MTSTMPTQTLAPTRTWSTVLFDLDGTIVDSAADITASLAHMFTALGLDVPSDDVLRSYVGPPLLAPVRGVFAAQEIKPQARVLATDRGIGCLVLDYDAMRGVDDVDSRLF